MSDQSPKINIKIDADASKARSELARTGKDFEAFSNTIAHSGAKDKSINDVITKRMAGIQEDYQLAMGRARESRARGMLDTIDYRAAGAQAAKNEVEGYLNMIDQLRKNGKLTPARYAQITEAFKDYNPVDMRLANDAGFRLIDKYASAFAGIRDSKLRLLREEFAAGLIDEKEFIRRADLVWDAFNKRLIGKANEVREKTGPLSVDAEKRLDSALHPRDRGTIALAKDEGYQMANATAAQYEEQLTAAMSRIRIQQAAGRINPIDAGAQEAQLKTQHAQNIYKEMVALEAQGKLTAPAMNRLAKSIQDVEKSSNSGSTALHNFRRNMFDLLSVGIAIGIMVNAWKKAIQDVKEIAVLAHEVNQFDVMERSFSSMMSAINAGPDVLENLRKSTRGLVDDQDLFKASNLAVSLRVVRNQDELERLTRAGSILGRAFGGDATKGVEDLTVAIGRQSTRVLDNLGIYLRVEEAKRIYAARIGVKEKDLTPEQQHLAWMTIALERAEARAKQFGQQYETTAEKVDRFTTSLKNARIEALKAAFEAPNIGEFFDKFGINQIDSGSESNIKRMASTYANVIGAQLNMVVDAISGTGSLIAGHGNGAFSPLLHDLTKGMDAFSRGMNHVFKDDVHVGMLEYYDKQIAGTRQYLTLLEHGLGKESELYRRNNAELQIMINNRNMILQQQQQGFLAAAYGPEQLVTLPSVYVRRPRRPVKPEPEPDDGKDPYQDLEKRARALIQIYTEQTHRGTDTVRVVRELNSVQRELNTAAQATSGTYGEIYARVLGLAGSVRDALAEVPFKEFERNARLAIKAYDEVYTSGNQGTLAQNATFREMVQNLMHVNELLRNQTGLTREVREGAEALRNDIQHDLIDKPVTQIQRSFSNAQQAIQSGLTQGWDLEGTFDRIDELERRLREVRHLGATLVDPHGRSLVTEEEASQIRALLDQMQQVRQTRPYAQIEHDAGILTTLAAAQRSLVIDVGATTHQMEPLLQQARQLLALGMTNLLPMTREQITKLTELVLNLQNGISPEGVLNTTRGMNVDTLRIMRGERAARMQELRNQVFDYQKQGIDKLEIEKWLTGQLIEENRSHYQAIHDIAQEALGQISSLLRDVASQSKTVQEGLRDIERALLDTFSNMAIQSGMEAMYKALINLAFASKAANQAGQMSTPSMTTMGLAGSVTSQAGSVATQTGTSAATAGLVTAGGLSGPAGLALIGVGLGLSVVSGLLGRDSKKREDEQFRATLRALRQNRDEQFLNFTIVLPGTPINPGDRAWQEALAESISQISNNRMGRIQFVKR